MSRPGPAFSNGTSGEIWMAKWCYRCLVDAPFQNGISQTGCPLILTAYCGEIPDEWMDGEESQDYTCLNFKPKGWRDPEPRPQPPPPNQDGLFPEPDRGVRMLTETHGAAVLA